jgi:inosine triphosphate pyrophosphatase
LFNLGILGACFNKSWGEHLKSFFFLKGMIDGLVFVTGNENKKKEVEQILKMKIQTADIDLTEIQGDLDTVTIAKAREACKILNCPVLVEDTALVFNAMNGLPGPYIKWFLKALGPAGLYNMLHGFQDKSAQAICTFGLCIPGNDPLLFQGRTDGHIVSPRGPTSFGWDPIFKPVGFDLTYAEMDKDVKNSISHRFKAVKSLSEHLSI